MSGRYIKVSALVPDSREVGAIMRACRCSRAEAFLGWFSFIAWLDERTCDGSFPAAPADIDRVAGLSGFAKALENIGAIVYNGYLAVYTTRNVEGRTSKARNVAKAANALKAVKARQRKAVKLAKVGRDAKL